MTSATQLPMQSLSAPQLSPEGRAALAWSDMRQDMLRQLWQAVLGEADANLSPAQNAAASAQMLGIDPAILLALQGENAGDAAMAQAAGLTPFAMGGTGLRASGTDPNAPLTLEGNAIYQPYLESASARTGLPAAMLASIVDAEAASHNGVWDPGSRNPRSSAAGLTQFLASTWESETERPGTYLNGVARERGWLDQNGRVLPAAREDLLALRFDPRSSIEAAADYARANLSALENQGLVHDGLPPEELAKRAYLAHHLGVGDAARFLTTGLDPSRARVLLASQIGGNAAAHRIQAAGDATAAHRQWLTAYVDRKIRLEDHQRRTITV